MEERELEQTNISLAFVRCTDEDVGLSAFPLQRANVCVLDVASEKAQDVPLLAMSFPFKREPCRVFLSVFC